MSSAAVLDCSALIRGLVDDGPSAGAMRARLRCLQTLVAPTLIDYELMSALLGLVRGGKLTDARFVKGIADFRRLGIEQHATLGLWQRVRELNHDVSAYNAHYVALAEVLGLPLITCDARIKRSGAAKCEIEVFD